MLASARITRRNRIRKSVGSRVFDAFNALALFMLAVVTLYPFLRILAVSLSSPYALNAYPTSIIPRNFTLTSYLSVLHNDNVTRGFLTSAVVTVVGTLSDVLLTAMLAYPLSKKRLPHRNFFTAIFVATMFFSAGLIPTYLNIKSLGLLNNYLVFILPRLISTFYLLICRNFFMSISPEIEESASVDGANDITILFRLIVPISKPILVTLLLWYGVARWNSYFDCVLYVTDSKKFLLSVVLRNIIMQGTNERAPGDKTSIYAQELIRASTIVVSVIPILLVYPFLQKYFVKGIMVGSLKG
jgi:putative aldouronate transport system permease protein